MRLFGCVPVGSLSFSKPIVALMFLLPGKFSFARYLGAAFVTSVHTCLKRR
jgi:hypothetical protein